MKKEIICPYKSTNGNKFHKCSHKSFPGICPYSNPKKCKAYNQWLKLKKIEEDGLKPFSDTYEAEHD